MKKNKWNPGTVLYPLPVVMVSCGTVPEDYNIVTAAWTGTVCTDPPMTYISLRKERYSYGIIKKAGCFVLNLITAELVWATDFCGIKSGRKMDKFDQTGLTPESAETINAPVIKESPVNIECCVTEIKELGSHDMFLAKVTSVSAAKKYFNKKGAFQFRKIEPVCFAHGRYYLLGAEAGRFGFSGNKKTHRKKR